MNVFERVRDTMAGTFNLEPGTVTENTRQTDVNKWDSLGHINLMVALEGEFDLGLEPEDFAKLTSVPAILTYLRAQGIE